MSAIEIPFADTCLVMDPTTKALLAYRVPLDGREVLLDPRECEPHLAGWCGRCQAVHDVSVLRYTRRRVVTPTTT